MYVYLKINGNKTSSATLLVDRLFILETIKFIITKLRIPTFFGKISGDISTDGSI